MNSEQKTCMDTIHNFILLAVAKQMPCYLCCISAYFLALSWMLRFLVFKSSRARWYLSWNKTALHYTVIRWFCGFTLINSHTGYAWTFISRVVEIEEIYRYLRDARDIFGSFTKLQHCYIYLSSHVISCFLFPFICLWTEKSNIANIEGATS